MLLAAGRSSRAGTFKMEVELAGKPLLVWSLEAMAAVCERVIVVAGFAPEKIRRLVAGRPGVELVVNENFAAGMLTSVQAGVRLVRAPRFFLLPGDMPLVRAAVYRKLLAAQAEIVVPVCRGRRGHPVLLGEPPDPRHCWPNRPVPAWGASSAATASRPSRSTTREFWPIWMTGRHKKNRRLAACQEGKMNKIQFWEFVHENLQADEPVLLLLVVESGGSSPGKPGFKMAVTADGRIHGTIGGGIMERELAGKAGEAAGPRHGRGRNC